jgi:hypothetical protein
MHGHGNIRCRCYRLEVKFDVLEDRSNNEYGRKYRDRHTFIEWPWLARIHHTSVPEASEVLRLQEKMISRFLIPFYNILYIWECDISEHRVRKLSDKVSSAKFAISADIASLPRQKPLHNRLDGYASSLSLRRGGATMRGFLKAVLPESP